MRIHVHNAVDGHLSPVTVADWKEAGGDGHQVTFGDNVQAYRAIAAEVDVLLCATLAMQPLFPLDATRLKVVSCMSAGLEYLAPFNWLPPGVQLLNNSGVQSPKVAEYVLMALLMLVNRMPEFAALQQQRQWTRCAPGTLAGKRLTVLGLGSIGQACAHKARLNGMTVTGIRRSAATHPDCVRVVGIDQLAEILPATDYLVATLPMTDDTAGVLNADVLARLPGGAGVINVGRGGVIDEKALCALLDSGHLGGAVLDVFDAEPLLPDSPVWTTRNLIVTPHVSAEDLDIYNVMTIRVLLDNLAAMAAGQPMPNAFDTAAGTRRHAA